MCSASTRKRFFSLSCDIRDDQRGGSHGVSHLPQKLWRIWNCHGCRIQVRGKKLTSVVVIVVVVSIVSIPHSHITARYVIVYVPKYKNYMCESRHCTILLGSLINHTGNRVADKRCNPQFSLSVDKAGLHTCWLVEVVPTIRTKIPTSRVTRTPSIWSTKCDGRHHNSTQVEGWNWRLS